MLELFNLIGVSPYIHNILNIYFCLHSRPALLRRHTKAQQFNGQQILQLPKLTEERVWLEFPPEQQRAYKRLYDLAKTQFDRYESAGQSFSKTIIVLQLLTPVRRACAGDRIDIAQLEADFKIEEERLRAMGFSAADISAGKQFVQATVAAFNAGDVECSVCLDALDDPMQTPCHHQFCRECIMGVVQSQGKCPICRAPVTMQSLRQPYKSPAEVAAAAAAAAASSSSSSSSAAAAAEVGGFLFDAKINALMTELDKMKAAYPDTKALVFTQFTSTQALLKTRLTEKGIKWHTISGDMDANRRQRIIDAFNSDAAGCVFLLTLRTGAVGLTLTAATHVFLLDPSLNPALEQQAKNRVYRFGQTKVIPPLSSL